MQTSKQVLRQDVHKKDSRKTQNPRWHVSLSAVRRLFSRGDICRSGVKRLVNRGFGYSWTYSPHLRPGVRWVGISNFITCHKRETGCSGEHCTPPPSSTLRLLIHETPHLSLEVALGKKRQRFPQWEGWSCWPASVYVAFRFLIDSKGVTSCWSCKARSCLFIYLSIRIGK